MMETRSVTLEDILALFTPLKERQEAFQREQEAYREAEAKRREEEAKAEAKRRLAREEEENRRREKIEADLARMEAAVERTQANVEHTNAAVGGLSNSFGRWGEAQFQCRLWEKLNTLGYNFGSGSNGPKKFFKGKQVLAECDDFIENGNTVCIAEIKNHATKAKIDEHIHRIEKIRALLTAKGDSRIIIGAMAAVVWEKTIGFDAKEYAFSEGLIVLTQSNENVEATPPPKGWTAKTWE